MARSSQSAKVLDQLGASVVTGDIFDVDALTRLVKGRRRVFHIAGVNEMCSRDPDLLWHVNVEGSRSVVDASARAGVERMILTSSAVTIGEPSGTIGTETSKHRGHFLSEYERSKTVAERLALDRVDDFEVVSVNPSSVQGPGRSTGTGAIFLAAARGRLPILVDAAFSLVDIDDCARGHLLAAERGVSGERYVLSGQATTIREAVGALGRLTGVRPRPWYVTPRAVTTLAPVVDAGLKMIGADSRLCAESTRVLLHGHSYDGSRATRELGLAYADLTDTLERTISWFRAEGLLN
jgi:dihydroflavonol-4-reductase